MFTRPVARHIVGTTFTDLPREAVEAAKKSILDTLGVMLPPTTLVNTAISVYELMSNAGGKPESTLIGYGGKAPCWVAAFVNGALIHAVDFDDCVGLERPICHPSGSSFPAALATAERVGRVSGQEFITAVALAHDLMVRIASTPKGNALVDYPFFPATTFGIFSTTAASGKLLGLNETQMVNAFGLALNRVSGVHRGLFDSDLRAIRDSLSNREGVLCALLAGKGMDACQDGLELFFSTYYQNDINPENMTADLGQKFRGSEVGFKPWPSCLVTHTFVQSLLKAIHQYHLQASEVTEIVMHGNQMAEDLFLPYDIKQNPVTSIAAKASVPFVMGVALLQKDVTIANFLPENLSNPEVLEIAKKVKYQLDPSLGIFSSRADIKTRDGREYHSSVDVLKGSIENPLSTNELVAKFKDCALYARKPLSQSDVDKLIDRILNLEKIVDMAEITSILS